MTLAIGVDIGGTKVAAGVVDEDGRDPRDAASRHPAPRDAAQTEDAIAEIGARPAQPATTSSRSASAPPASSTTTGPRCCSRRTSPGATSRCSDAVERRIGLPVVVENDANAAAWAEAGSAPGSGESTSCASRSAPASAAASSSTASCYRGRFGIAGEFGHMQVVPDGRRCELRQPRLLGAVRRGQRAGARGPRAGRGRRPGAPDLLALGGGRPERHRGPAGHRRPPARATRRRWRASPTSADGSASGMANLAAALDPGVVRHRRRRVARPGRCCIEPAQEAFADG